MIDASDLGKWFINNNYSVAAGTKVGHIKLQKLLYYSKAMYYAVHGDQLFPQKVEAWEKGPVVKEAYIDYRYNKLTTEKHDDLKSITPEVERVLKVVNHIYGYQTSDSLINLTHQEKPWKDLESLVSLRANPTIEEDVIKEYYSELREIFNVIDDEELVNTKFMSINGNAFSYDPRDIEINSEIRQQLWELGSQSKNDIYAIYLDEDGELVIY